MVTLTNYTCKSFIKLTPGLYQIGLEMASAQSAYFICFMGDAVKIGENKIEVKLAKWHAH